MKTLTWAEIAAIIICTLFMAAVVMVRLLTEEGEGGFTVAGTEAQDIAVADTGHYTDGLLCLNCATAQELDLLPGIGGTLAERILQYREQNGEFTDIEEFDNVYGIGESIIEQIRGFVTVEGHDEDSGG